MFPRDMTLRLCDKVEGSPNLGFRDLYSTYCAPLYNLRSAPPHVFPTSLWERLGRGGEWIGRWLQGISDPEGVDGGVYRHFTGSRKKEMVQTDKDWKEKAGRCPPKLQPVPRGIYYP